VTVIPEIEGPAHSNAALASVPEINCDGTAPELFIGIGPSPDGDLCTDFGPTYRFLDTVIGQIAALTPGPYLHVGGDEAGTLTADQYATYVHNVQSIVAKYGKKMVGWQEVLAASDPKRSVGEYWAGGINDEQVLAAARNGAKVVMAPAPHTYLDMRYSADGPPEFWLGLTWAGYVDVQDAYNWDPTTFLSGLPASSVIGVEAPLWTDTVFGMLYIEEMAFPRLPAVAEIGWSPASTHDWNAFRTRLAAQGARWSLMEVNYFPSTQVPWPSGS
jgi:hexosaminidase